MLNRLLGLCPLLFIAFSPCPINASTPAKQEFHASNLKDISTRIKSSRRTQNYPTQLFKIQIKLDPETTLDEIHQRFDDLFFGKVMENNFYYNVSGWCFSWPDVQTCTIQGFYEPADDRAVDVANKIRLEANGADYFGTPIVLDESKLVVLNINTRVGRVKHDAEDDWHFTPVFEANTTMSFKSYYDADKGIIDNIDQNFEPRDEGMIFSLISDIYNDIYAYNVKDFLFTNNGMHIKIIPAFLYTDSLKVYPFDLGFTSDNRMEICGEEEQDTCLS